MIMTIRSNCLYEKKGVGFEYPTGVKNLYLEKIILD